MLLLITSVMKIFSNPNADRSISPSGLKLIKRFENISLKAYQDEAGVWTVGWGSTKGVKEGMRITIDRANEWFARDVLESEKTVKKFIDIPLSQNQYDALVSFTYNVGGEALRISTLRKLLNTKNYQSVPSQMQRWNKVTVKGVKKVSNGLVRRRKLESEVFLGTYPA